MQKDAKKFLRIIVTIALIMSIAALVLMILSAIREKNNTYVNIDMNSIELVQLEEPEEGEPIAVVDTSLGEIRFVLYPEYSPNAVANFIELAESGYYDNTYVYNSESGVYSSAGSKEKDGSFDKGDRHERIERELNQDLWTFKGAVCSVTTTYDRSFKEALLGGGTYYNGSRIHFLNTIEFTDELKSEMRESSDNSILTDAFIEKGGIPNFSQQMTVIGQVYEGLDIVEQLASLDATDNGNYKIPDEDVRIISVKISEYSEADEK